MMPGLSKDAAAVAIQRIGRGMLGRRRMERVLLQAMSAELDTAAATIQNSIRGRSSRQKMASELEAVMLEDIESSATRIQTSFRGHKARRDNPGLVSLSNTPRTDTVDVDVVDEADEEANMEARDAYNGVPVDSAAFAFLKDKYEQTATATTKKAPDTAMLKDKIDRLRTRASKLCTTVDGIEPVFSGVANQVSEVAEVQAMRIPRPFSNVKANKDLSSLCVAVVGRNSVSVNIAIGLARCGVGNFIFFESEASSVEDIPGVLRMDAIKTVLRTMNKSVKTTVHNFELNETANRSDADLGKDRTAFMAEAKTATFILCCDDGAGAKKTVSEAAEEADVAWMHASFNRGNVSFHYQFYRAQVIEVLPHDVVIQPYNDPMKKWKLANGTAGVNAIVPGATGTFASLASSNIVRFWLGCKEVQGYTWFNPVYNCFSSLGLLDIRSMQTPSIGT